MPADQNDFSGLLSELDIAGINYKIKETRYGLPQTPPGVSVKTKKYCVVLCPLAEGYEPAKQLQLPLSSISLWITGCDGNRFIDSLSVLDIYLDGDRALLWDGGSTIEDPTKLRSKLEEIAKKMSYDFSISD